MIIHTLNQKALEVSSTVVRLPVTAAARLTGNADDRTWPPAVALDSAMAALAGLIARITHDSELGQQAASRRVAVQELRRAAALETVAESERAEADDKLARRRAAADDQRDQAARVADARRATAKRTAQRRERAAARAEADQREAAQAAEQKEKARARRAARAARLEELEVEKTATTTAQRAAAKRSRAKAADAGVRTSRARRAAS